MLKAIQQLHTVLILGLV